MIAGECFHLFRGYGLNGLVVAACEFLREVADQQRNIFAPLTQRRHGDGEDIQPVKEVAAKLAFRDHLCQVAIGRRDHADVDTDGARAAQPFEFLFLQNAQQLGLEFEGDVPDFIQKQRSLVGEFEAADLLRDGAGERAPFVAEEFAFQQPGGDRRAIHLDEGAVASPAQVVDGARDEFLAGARLALDQHGGIGGGHGLHLAEDALERRAFADDLLEVVLGADFLFEVELLLRQLVLELGDLLIGQSVLDGDGDLVGDQSEQVHVLLRKCPFAQAGQAECPQGSVGTVERDDAR